jgi:hypothetical protein
MLHTSAGGAVSRAVATDWRRGRRLGSGRAGGAGLSARDAGHRGPGRRGWRDPGQLQACLTCPDICSVSPSPPWRDPSPQPGSTTAASCMVSMTSCVTDCRTTADPSVQPLAGLPVALASAGAAVRSMQAQLGVLGALLDALEHFVTEPFPSPVAVPAAGILGLATRLLDLGDASSGTEAFCPAELMCCRWPQGMTRCRRQPQHQSPAGCLLCSQ